MNYTTIQVQVLDVQSEQFTGPHPTNPGKMKQNLVLALRLVHNLPNFLLREPALLNIRDSGKRGIPFTKRLIALLRMPIHNRPKKLPEIMNRLWF